ncbi:hypothetical protein JTY60_01380 [symbiont of Argiope bruennichi]|uniref:MATE family efflux transporter n=1 Tax=symbiont of Argiope bruennichi TaxID=2810479 RepID=UPI003DA4B1CC
MKDKTKQVIISNLTRDMINQKRLEEIYLHSTIWKSLLRIIVPTVLSMAVFSLYSIIDQIIAIQYGSGNQIFIHGSLDSKDIRTVIQLAQPFWGILIGIGVFITTGVGNKFGMFLGEANFKRAKDTLSNGYFYNFIFYFFLLFFCFIFSKKIIELQFSSANVSLDKHNEIVNLSYYTTLIWAFFAVFYFISNIAIIGLRVEGYPTFAFLTIFFSSILNVALDFLFTIVFHWGVLGTIFATGIAWFFQFIASFLFCFWKKVYVIFEALKIKKDALTKTIIFACFIFGFPSLFRNFAQAINTWFFNLILDFQSSRSDPKSLGYWVSIFGAITPIINLFVISVFGFLQSMNIFIPYNYAHKKNERIIKSVWICIFFVVVYLLFVEILCFFIGDNLLSLFIPKDINNPHELSDATHALRNLFLLFPLLGVSLVVSGFYQSIQKVSKSVLIIFLRFVLIYFVVLTLLYLLGKKYNNNYLVFYVTPITDLLVTFISVPLLMFDFKKLKQGKY